MEFKMANADCNIDFDTLHKLFEYKDGLLLRKITTSNNAKAGSIVGCLNNNGYLVVRINDKLLYVHRIIYMLHNGISNGVVDHVDMNKLNNKIENLRLCSISQNLQNRTKTAANTSGYKNVYWCASEGKYKVQVTKNKHRYHGGTFDCVEEANKSAQHLRKVLHERFARN